MGEDPERIEREIERTRAKLGEDLDALEEKINPKKVAHRSVDRAKEKAAEVKDKVIGAAGAAKEKASAAAASGGSGPSGELTGPTPAGTTGATALNGQSGGAGAKASGLVDTAREKVGPLAATAKDRAGMLATTAKERAAARSGMDPQTADTRQVATAVAGEAWQTVREQTRRNPVGAGAAAFVIGVLLGR